MQKKEDDLIIGSSDEQSSNVRHLLLPDGIKFIYRRDVGDRDITLADIPRTVCLIGEAAFEGCTSLERVRSRAFISTLSKHAFADCTSLREVDLSYGVSKLCEGVFKGCTSLERIVIKPRKDDFTLGARLFDGVGKDFTIEFYGTSEQFKRVSNAVVGKKAVGFSGDYHHPSSSHFEEITANIYAPVFSSDTGKQFTCTVICKSDGVTLEYPSVNYYEWS